MSLKLDTIYIHYTPTGLSPSRNLEFLYTIAVTCLMLCIYSEFPLLTILVFITHITSRLATTLILGVGKALKCSVNRLRPIYIDLVQ